MIQKPLKVSVIIPAFNEEERIGACLSSLMKQRVKPFEIIVVDNNSTDQTAAIARNFKSVKVVLQKQQGRGWAQTLGFNIAKGNILARIDADTVVNRNWVEQIQNTFRQYEIDALSGFGVTRTGITIKYVSKLFSWVYYNHAKAYFGADTLWGSNMAISKRIWKKAKKYVVNGVDLHEDQDLALAIASVGGRIKVDSSLLVSVDFNDIQYFDKYYRYNKMKRSVKLIDISHHRYHLPLRQRTNILHRLFLHSITIEFIYFHYLFCIINSYSKQLAQYSKLSAFYYWYKNL